MAWTQADVDALKAAIASGVKSVHYAGPPARTTVYQDTSAMLDALAIMIAEVEEDDRPAYTLLQSSQGFDGGLDDDE
jgi:hypothetical protein